MADLTCKKEIITNTLIVVVLDESGSMDIQKNDVIGGYNSFIDRQRDITEDQARLVLVKFNNKVTVAHSIMPLCDVPKLNNQLYSPSGNTALYDAISESIRMAEVTVQPNERVLVLIMTDGEENSSKKATLIEVKDMIKSHENVGNWTFAYIGQNPEAWANKMSVAASNSAQYNMVAQGRNFSTVGASVMGFRQQRQQQQLCGFFQQP